MKYKKDHVQLDFLHKTAVLRPSKFKSHFYMKFGASKNFLKV
ncbi:hypothetical protein LEP1GSC204_0154 [Leptospira interrogans serovar Copenhageni str. M20]|uniref:Uncharacterized protein n=1 Tax=Leptospira interrogans str. UI 12758 TaxID=1049938 RepID=A0A0E2DN39_LEPIR|nr:hypothetical protein LEP1GSC105_4890 [Leptospira interrogans str. UI 12758]EMY52851.1 hypothetical protein LEP1GSC204_0154 [Leptospira interrogans serovar Copenhageni str. M20]